MNQHVASGSHRTRDDDALSGNRGRTVPVGTSTAGVRRFMKPLFGLLTVAVRSEPELLAGVELAALFGV